LGKLKILGITKRHTSKDKWDLNKAFLLEKIGKPIEKSKIEILVTLLQLTLLVGFLPMAGKIRSTRRNFP
jgi:hypothetical protein